MSYSPTLGRWMEQDPAGYVDGANLYQYVSGNPTGLVDPTGLVGEDLRQVDEIVRRFGLNQDGRRALHEALQDLKGCDGKVPKDVLEEVAEEIRQTPKYLKNAGRGRGGVIDSEFLGANPMGLASAATLLVGAYAAIKGSAHALDTDTIMQQEFERMRQLDAKEKIIRAKLKKSCGCKPLEDSTGPKYDDGTALT